MAKGKAKTFYKKVKKVVKKSSSSFGSFIGANKKKKK